MTRELFNILAAGSLTAMTAFGLWAWIRNRIYHEDAWTDVGLRSMATEEGKL